MALDTHCTRAVKTWNPDMAVDATASQMGNTRENASHISVADFLHLNHRAITIFHSPLLSEDVLTFKEDPEDIWVLVNLTTVGLRSIRLVPSLPVLQISLSFEFLFPLFFIFNRWESNINLLYRVRTFISNFIFYNSRHHKEHQNSKTKKMS